MIPSKIDKEAFNQLPLVGHTGNIFVANDETQAEAAIAAIRESHCIVGFDTETRPAFVKGVTYKVCLVQLSAGKTGYLFRLNLMKGIPACLKQLLEDNTVIKVGLSTHDDFQNLRKWDDTLAPRGFIELQHLVKGYGIEEMSLAKIYALLFGKRISKRQRLTNWEAPSLTDKQLAYAAFDAVACVDIYTELTRMGHQIINR